MVDGRRIASKCLNCQGGNYSRKSDKATNRKINSCGDDHHRHSDGDDGSSADGGATQPADTGEHVIATERTMALCPVSDIDPVRMMQALQGSIEALQAQAARIAKSE